MGFSFDGPSRPAGMLTARSRSRLFLLAMLGAMGMALYSVAGRPMMRSDEYRRAQRTNREAMQARDRDFRPDPSSPEEQARVAEVLERKRLMSQLAQKREAAALSQAANDAGRQQEARRIAREQQQQQQQQSQGQSQGQDQRPNP
ncbi:hypothetical protein CAOG_01165 [Capsaspora owczarzaki ATCC 30864]|uniref:Uncharacterized protein n=1 Tax=Capsaspora owczarzaki (strain ATCC 30864) TaxID=595528 RepID=A0A0D2U3F6_CAPO3|nr:hypothetical protein CAOG_01165 [Capsaspora owczarzaki ATCC 30864]KJE89736.1 hypothetical protein CAOG_001165 [Capsaspora owczarzaki ATCC 30864]|eukprot:XP_004366036.1 hypothetical protein CAOG_01165 [Capsaspora owczarzaki ATCC 30864]